jgi:putative MATE family efflux protein
MKLLLATAVLNMILDPLFMFPVIPYTSIKGLGWGMFGSAMATCIAYLVAFLIGFAYVLGGKAPLSIRFKNIFHLDLKLDKKLLSIGLPSGLHMLLRSLVTFIFLKLVAKYGVGAIASLGIANRIYQFCSMPSNGLSMGSGILVGQRLGSKQYPEAQQVAYLSILNGLLFSLPLFLALMLFPSAILSLFLGGAEPTVDAMFLLRVYALCLICLSVSSGLGASFYGSGHTRPILYSSLISGWLIQVPYALVVASLLLLPLPYLWAAYLIGDVGDAAARWVWFSKRRWMEEP